MCPPGWSPACPSPSPLRRSQRLANVAVPLARAPGILLTIAKLRDLDLRQRDADEVFALLPNHLAAADVLAEVAFHLAADKLAEALMIAFDFLSHVEPLSWILSEGSRSLK